MPRLAWATDLHLNFLDDEAFRAFATGLAEEAFDVLAISGDIAESPNVARYLRLLEKYLARPICFVLGNHDYYRGSIAATRQQICRLADQSPYLVYLNHTDLFELSPTTGLVGHDGWGDARLGDFHNTSVLLSDFFLIEELTIWRAPGDPRVEWDAHARELIEPVLHALGDEAASHFARVLPPALERYPHVIALTHVPPFAEACWYGGRPSNGEWLPFFACQAVGDVLVETMRRWPDRRLDVLCGHTHGGGEAHILDNLRVLAGVAQYSHPALARIFDL